MFVSKWKHAMIVPEGWLGLGIKIEIPVPLAYMDTRKFFKASNLNGLMPTLTFISQKGILRKSLRAIGKYSGSDQVSILPIQQMIFSARFSHVISFESLRALVESFCWRF